MRLVIVEPLAVLERPCPGFPFRIFFFFFFLCCQHEKWKIYWLHICRTFSIGSCHTSSCCCCCCALNVCPRLMHTHKYFNLYAADAVGPIELSFDGQRWGPYPFWPLWLSNRNESNRIESYRTESPILHISLTIVTVWCERQWLSHVPKSTKDSFDSSSSIESNAAHQVLDGW